MRVWSPEQLGIFEWFADPVTYWRNLIVRARAGCAKTTTIIEGVNRAREEAILIAAFSADIAAELKQRIATPNAQAMTLHGLGRRLVLRVWEGIGVSERGDRARALAAAVTDDTVPDPIKRLIAKLCTQARELVPHATGGEDLLWCAEEFELDPPEEWSARGFDVGFVCAKAYEAMELAAAKQPLETGIDYADMLYLPIRNGWIRELFDLVVVDEAQDMTLTQLELARGVCGGRLCIVGDDRQAIFGFRGADSEALDRLKVELSAEERTLNRTYRCARSIVEVAARLVPDYTAAPEAPEGHVLGPVALEALPAHAEPGDFVLSRTRAPLAKVAMSFLRSNKRVRVLGRDIGDGLIGLARALMTGAAASGIPAFLERLVRWEEREVQRAIAANKPERVESIRDKAATLIVLTEGVLGPAELIARLDALFTDKGNAASLVTLSTIHKIKGQEARRVFVLRDTLHPVPPKGVQVTPKRMLEEQNLEYVAVTRAREVLVWVAGK